MFSIGDELGLYFGRWLHPASLGLSGKSVLSFSAQASAAGPSFSSGLIAAILSVFAVLRSWAISIRRSIVTDSRTKL